jgi:hypothetical protein
MEEGARASLRMTSSNALQRGEVQSDSGRQTWRVPKCTKSEKEGVGEFDISPDRLLNDDKRVTGVADLAFINSYRSDQESASS